MNAGPSFAYATPDTLTDGGWLPTTPDNAAALLRSATVVVAEAANRNPYTDTPTGPDALVLADATCAQVAAWVTSKVSPSDPVGGAGVVKERSFDTARFVYDTTGQADTRIAVSKELAPEARRILYVGGLLALPLPVGTDQLDTLPTYGLPTPLGGIGYDPYGREALRDAGYGYGGGSGGYGPFFVVQTVTSTPSPADPITVTGDYELGVMSPPIFANASTGPILILIDPEPAGGEVSVKKIDTTTNAVTLRSTNGALIDGQTQFVIATPFMSVDLLSDGTNLFLH